MLNEEHAALVAAYAELEERYEDVKAFEDDYAAKVAELQQKEEEFIASADKDSQDFKDQVAEIA